MSRSSGRGNSGGNSGSGNNSGNGSSGSGSGSRKRKKSRKKPKLDPVKYWGDPSALPSRNDYTLETADPTAVIRSLGKAPIPGKNSAPELYFEVLYSRAAGLAQALAFAGGLNQDDPDATSSDGTSPDGSSSANASADNASPDKANPDKASPDSTSPVTAGADKNGSSNSDD